MIQLLNFLFSTLFFLQGKSQLARLSISYTLEIHYIHSILDRFIIDIAFQIQFDKEFSGLLVSDIIRDWSSFL